MTWVFIGIVCAAIPVLSIRAQQRLGSGPLPLPRRDLYGQTMIVQAILCSVAVVTAKVGHISVFAIVPAPRAWFIAGGFLAVAFLVLAIGWRIRSHASRDRLVDILPQTREELALYLPLCAVAGVSEELVYRGVLFCALVGLLHNVPFAIAVAAIAFGLAHATQGAGSVAIIIGIGAALHALVLITGSLLPAVAVHIAYDATAAFLVPRLRGDGEYNRGTGGPPMYRSAAAVAALLWLAVPAFATQPNPSQRQRELIEQILDITKPENMVRDILDGMLVQMQANFDKENAQHDAAYDENKKDFERYRELVRTRIDYKQWVHDIYLPLYAKHFSEAQLADLLVFYKTSAGRALITELPLIEREAMQANNDEIVAKFGEIAKQVQDERHKRRPWEPTMADIRAVATACEAYATDENKYPAADSWDDLGKILSPTYIKTMPQKDGWGSEYAYVVSEDRLHYRIVSAGGDSAFEFDSRRIAVLKKTSDADEGPPTKYSDNLSDDIIYADGAFVQAPKEAKP